MPVQIGHYGPADLQWFIEHSSLALPLVELEESGVSYDFDPSIEAAGKGLGLLKNFYYKQTDAAKGTLKLSRAHLDRVDNGYLFIDLAQGTKYIIQETAAAAATTYTTTQAIVGIFEVRLNTSLVLLTEGIDYTVNYVTGALTFAAALPEAVTIRYQSLVRRNQNLLINGGFEDALGSAWVVFGTATIARNTANAYVESNALGVTPAALNDGVQYNIAINVKPGRTYRLRYRAKAAAAEVMTPFWNDGTTDIAMSPATATLTTTYAEYEHTFTATKAQVVNIKIKDSKASPALFYLDDVALLDDTSGSGPSLGVNPMDAGLGMPFMFNVVGRRTVDGVAVHHFNKCAVDKTSFKSGKLYTEAIDCQFLDYYGE